MAKCRVQRLRTVMEVIMANEKQAEKDRATNKQRRLERKLEQRINPRTRQDFELLYNDLESESFQFLIMSSTAKDCIAWEVSFLSYSDLM